MPEHEQPAVDQAPAIVTAETRKERIHRFIKSAHAAIMTALSEVGESALIPPAGVTHQDHLPE